VRGKVKNRLKNQNGASAVEFAIILPILVTLVFGIIEVGLLLYNQQVLTNASREGARAAIRGTCDPGSPNYRLNDSEIEDIVENYCVGRLITLGGISSPPTATVAPSPIACVLGVGDNVTVTAQYTYTFLASSILGLGPTQDLSAATVMKMESNP
jgi:Flp pilus assembly protein TadG